jgi:hypothetical protein
MNEQFVLQHGNNYQYNFEYLYQDNINTVFDNWESFLNLYYWKNQHGENMSQKKLLCVQNLWMNRKTLIQLRIELQNNNQFNWDLFEGVFQPSHSSTIWKILLLHLIKPDYFPIFDQHVYRSFFFLNNNIIQELPSKKNLRWIIYKKQYLPWFIQSKNELNFNRTIEDENYFSTKKIDQSLFVYGKILKNQNNQ